MKDLAVLHLSPETEALAKRIAAARGVTIDDAVRQAIEAAGRSKANQLQDRTPRQRDELIRRMEEISARSGARPLVDPRSPDELLGYDDYGVPR